MLAEIEIKIDVDKTISIDLMWLRDHCRCKECYDVATFQRKTSVLELPDDISVKSYAVEEGILRVTCMYNSIYDLIVMK